MDEQKEPVNEENINSGPVQEELDGLGKDVLRCMIEAVNKSKFHYLAKKYQEKNPDKSLKLCKEDLSKCKSSRKVLKSELKVCNSELKVLNETIDNMLNSMESISDRDTTLLSNEINLKEEGYIEEEMVSKRALSEIIEARVEEIFLKVNEGLKKIGREGLLPAGVILCGGGSKLTGMVEIAKRELKLPVALGYPLYVSSVSEKTGDPAFTTAISLVKWGSMEEEISGTTITGIFETIKGVVSKGFSSLRGIFGR